MMLARKLEPEVMDSETDAREYNSMDHSAVNRVFVDDLFCFAQRQFQEHGALGQGQLPEDEETISVFPLGDVLDVGTGTAQIPVALCKRHPYCRVMAMDLAASMLNLAVYNVEVAGLRQRIQLTQADAKQMLFSDELFDIVISNSILHHLADPSVCMREMLRVARPEGLLFIRDLMRPEDPQTLDHLVEQYAGAESDHSKRLFADSLHAALSLEEMQTLVSDLGYSPDTVTATSDRHWTWAVRKITAC
jgi:2-polyprenyl-3-methyl-5-hydroxy-6-metoxy-1,4-benzoquinol methylase